MPVEGTIRALLDSWDPAAVAIAAPANSAVNRAPLSRRQLAAQMDMTIAALRGLGVGRQDRVAMVLPNGPEMAALFLGVAAGAAAAPLNAAYREEEFDFYLSDIEAKLLLIEAGLESPARAVAARRGIPVVDVESNLEAEAGSYRLLRAGERLVVRAPRRPRLGPLRGCGAGAAYLRHHLAAEDRALDPRQSDGLGPQYRPNAGPRAFRPLPRHHAAVPYPRAGGGAALLHRRRGQPLLPAGIQCPQVLRLAR